jgi:hypothetical protein
MITPLLVGCAGAIKARILEITSSARFKTKGYFEQVMMMMMMMMMIMMMTMMMTMMMMMMMMSL